MKYLFTFFFLIILLESCKTKITVTEDPFKVAASYCDCIHAALRNAKDSSVNLLDCERKVFLGSRLLSIYADFGGKEKKYSRATLDSASDFAIKVRDIEDTLCYNKIDFKKVKKMRHF